jgi:hypothetical protein
VVTSKVRVVPDSLPVQVSVTTRRPLTLRTEVAVPLGSPAAAAVPQAAVAVPAAVFLVWQFPDLMFMSDSGFVLISNHTTLFQVTLPITLVVGYVVHRWVELPVTGFRRKLREKYQPSATTPT